MKSGSGYKYGTLGKWRPYSLVDIHQHFEGTCCLEPHAVEGHCETLARNLLNYRASRHISKNATPSILDSRRVEVWHAYEMRNTWKNVRHKTSLGRPIRRHTEGTTMFKQEFKRLWDGGWLASSGIGQNPAAACCDHGKEPSGLTKDTTSFHT